jgi:glycosyltransferase involved in cell wall biosynthesis
MHSKMMNRTVLGIVIPCYNENEIIEDSICRLLSLLNRYVNENRISNKSFIGIIDDRSRDNTWEVIKKLVNTNQQIKAIRLSSNLGHQYALLAGLTEFCDRADCLVSIDADLQDDIEVMAEMISRFIQGNEIVYGVRKKRTNDSSFKRISALAFYKFLKTFGANVIFNHADYRLTSRRVNEELKNFGETNLYLRGIFPLMGFNSALVYYDRKERIAGKTKYPLRKMISLALNGITSFSTVPLRMITFIGFFVFIICLFLMGYALLAYINGKTIAGWFSTVLPFYFLGGIQILCIGILGEYLGKIYKEVKRRPRFIVDERI